ncbi:MAG: electron transport complex subunit RsxD [Alteromonadaceae bacterium]|jgi:electron transport complex protein RnfD|uniref:Ion-translocating oxidoreductase complex subunit D n=1 Tax=Paraglaciecola chathamensis TaxID=368405 RepID=A0ABS0WBN5_9ALTE|nr:MULTISPECIES: electron transport complex subunit RsxD [Paraglaciecola]MBJ2135856.1 electron transport complex subunit RsxD [Paraglaciecola chathamensis]MBN27909.1 electron transport complex subunit RsxD [Alteromonadaceae bacterium]|tara:strand:- start:93224 stop:94297 length:1074 start_codon:yes stop_codon:yes gene_type:complete
MNYKLASSPHQHVRRNTGQIMRMVIYALIPGILLQLWFFGFGVLVQITLAVITAVITEATILEMRKRNFERAIKDYSAILTAILLAISIPPFAPWWVVVIGTFFAIAMVKQLYGGLGFNVFNPAMAAYVMLLVSFPVQMTQWLPAQSLTMQQPGIIDAIYAVFTGFSADGFSLAQLQSAADGHTMATPLDAIKTGLAQGLTYEEGLQSAIFDGNLGIGWWWVSFGYLLGGLYLIKAKIINWHIPGGMLAAMAICAGVMFLVDPDRFASPVFHIFNGSLILGAFFIATDPVSASTTNKGRIIFGAAIGFWVYVIRTWGGYPDAIAFSVLIMNMAVPLIDYYTRPRTYGHKKRSQGEPK